MEWDYKGSIQDEVQPAYSNFTFVTIHPTMIYFKQNNSLVQQGGDFVACAQDADKKIYLGKLQEIDYDDDDEVSISFMYPDLSLNPKMQSFRWPTHADELWVKRNSTFINIPLSKGKKRGF